MDFSQGTRPFKGLKSMIMSLISTGFMISVSSVTAQRQSSGRV